MNAHAFDLRSGRYANKALPSNIEAEQALLGVMLFDNRAADVLDMVKPDHFLEPVHGRMFAVMAGAIRAGRLADPILISDTMGADAALIELGGLRYLADLVNYAPPTQNAGEYARQIVDLAMRREVFRAAENLAAVALSDDRSISADQLVALGEQALGDIARGGGLDAEWLDGEGLGDALDEVLNRAAGLPGVSIGLKAVDDITNGLRPGKLIVIGGRPAMGKSAVAIQIMAAMAAQGRGAGMFSLEMDATEIIMRMACGLAFDMASARNGHFRANPNYFAVERGEVVGEARHRLLEARDLVRSWKPLLGVDSRSSLTPAQIVPAAKRLIRRWERDGIEPGCLIVDHLHIVKPDVDRSGNRAAELGDISGALRELGKDTGVPVVALAQLNRLVEGREVKDKRPGLADLRGSGDIEQDAYTVAFLHRPEYYVRPPDDPDDLTAEVAYQDKLSKVRNRLDWIVAKNRGGPTGQATTYCDIACNAIRDMGEGVE